jgi:hypothetical protein
MRETDGQTDRRTDGRTYAETHELSRVCENHRRVCTKSRQKLSLFLHLLIKPTRIKTNGASSYWADEDDVILTLSVHPLCSILGQERCTFTFSSHDKRKSPSISKKFVILMLSCCQGTILAPSDVS